VSEFAQQIDDLARRIAHAVEDPDDDDSAEPDRQIAA
jgi:hypothetical protein